MATHLRPALAAGLAAIFLLAACGGGSDSGPHIERTDPITLTQQDVCDVDLHTMPPDVTIHGADAGDFLADRFSLAHGDFNDDGIDDILVGAPLADGPGNERENAGEVYIIQGGGEPASEIDLAAAPAFTIAGGAAGDNLGFTVAAGDLNGDGIDDIVAGARFASPEERSNAGAAYVVFGGPGALASPAVGLDLATAAPDVTVLGGATGQLLTVALATGDLNGDGFADLLIGASGADGPDGDRIDAGAALAVLGSPSMPDVIDLAEDVPDLTVHGATAGDALPNRLAAGDLDGDGRDELIAGVPFADTRGGGDAGAVYAVLYSAQAIIDLAELTPTISGGGTRDGLGFAVAAADLNGDGVDDLIAGARDADGPGDSINNAGEIHVLFGGDDLPRQIDLTDDTSDMLIYSTDPGDSLGFNIATGELNGDGLADIVAGVPLAGGCQNGRFGAGDVYAIFGRAEPVPEAIIVNNAGDLTYFGPNDGDASGFSVDAADFNGDGVTDIIIGALQADGPDGKREDAGAVYIVLGEGQ